MDIRDFLAVLDDPTIDPSPQVRHAMARWGTRLANAHQKMPKETRERVLRAVESATKSEKQFQRQMALSLNYSVTGDRQSLALAAEQAMLGLGTIEEKLSNFHTLTRMAERTSPERNIVAPHLGVPARYEFWRGLVAQVRTILMSQDLLLEGRRLNGNRVVILVPRLLGGTDALSRDAFEFSRLLKTEFSLEPLIISTLEGGISPLGSVVPGRFGTSSPRYEGRRRVSYMGQLHDVYQPEGPGLTEIAARKVGETISLYRPSMVLALGGPSVFADVYSERVFSFLYPNQVGLPIVHGSYYGTFEPAPTEILKLAAEIGVRDRYLFHMKPPITPIPVVDRVRREDFDIPNDAFVCLVLGDRLDVEIDHFFVDDMMEVAAKNDDVFFLFAGPFKTYAQVFGGKSKLKGRHRLLDKHVSRVGLMGLSDVFINPQRAGGAQDMTDAMSNGLPCLTLAKGSGYDLAKAFPRLTSYREMADALVTLAIDDELQASYKRTALVSIDKLYDRKPLLSEILKCHDLWQQDRLEPWNGAAPSPLEARSSRPMPAASAHRARRG